MSIGTKEKQEQVTTLEVATAQTGRFTRQPLSVLEKIIFWISLVRGVGSIGGVIGIKLGTGVLSWDMVIIMVLSLVISVLLATRIRWASLVNSLLAGYLLYLTFTQPFIIESLINPYGADGGFGKFVGMVLNLACAILVFGGSIGAAVQNYRSGSRQTPRWLPSALSLVAGMIIGAIFIGALSQPATATGTAYTNGVPTVHIAASGFLQSSITMSKGSKLLLVDDTRIMHNLFNGSWQNGAPQIEREPGAPLVNNVRLSGNSITIGPFATAGTYHILCLIHRGMTLTVIVQ